MGYAFEDMLKVFLIRVFWLCNPSMEMEMGTMTSITMYALQQDIVIHIIIVVYDLC